MIQRFLKFFGTNLLGTGIDTLVLWLLADYVFSGYAARYLLAPALSFECAMLGNYVISYGWVSSERVQKTRGDFIRRLAGYQLNSLLVFGLKLLLLIATERLTGFHPILCNLIALILTGLLNFTSQEKLIFCNGSAGQKRPDRFLGAACGNLSGLQRNTVPSVA